MDLLAFLRQDHRELKSLMERMQSVEPGRESVRELQETIADLLTNHSKMEELYLYPRMCEVPQAKELIEHSYEEHAEASQLLQKITGERPMGETWLQDCKQLLEAVSHHIDEEEKTLFPLIEQNVYHGEMDQICRSMMEYREQQLSISPDLPVDPINRSGI